MTEAERPMDHVPPDDGVAHEEQSALEKNVKEKSTWMRLLFMLIMGIAGSIAISVTGAVIILNFLYVLFTGKAHSKLTEFGQALAKYLYQVIRFLSYNTETRPFPVDAEWPSSAQDE